MGDATGEADKSTMRLDFDRRVLLQLYGFPITSNAGRSMRVAAPLSEARVPLTERRQPLHLALKTRAGNRCSHATR